MLVPASNWNPPRERSNPISALNESRVSAGAPANTPSRASPARESRNRAAIWLAGTSVPIVCIAAGIVPIGM